MNFRSPRFAGSPFEAGDWLPTESAAACAEAEAHTFPVASHIKGREPAIVGCFERGSSGAAVADEDGAETGFEVPAWGDLVGGTEAAASAARALCVPMGTHISPDALQISGMIAVELSAACFALLTGSALADADDRARVTVFHNSNNPKAAMPPGTLVLRILLSPPPTTSYSKWTPASVNYPLWRPRQFSQFTAPPNNYRSGEPRTIQR